MTNFRIVSLGGFIGLVIIVNVKKNWSYVRQNNNISLGWYNIFANVVITNKVVEVVQRDLHSLVISSTVPGSSHRSVYPAAHEIQLKATDSRTTPGNKPSKGQVRKLPRLANLGNLVTPVWYTWSSPSLGGRVLDWSGVGLRIPVLDGWGKGMMACDSRSGRQISRVEKAQNDSMSDNYLIGMLRSLGNSHSSKWSRALIDKPKLLNWTCNPSIERENDTSKSQVVTWIIRIFSLSERYL
jgi:hypothetical protein